jgi:hypothetical protein
MSTLQQLLTLLYGMCCSWPGVLCCGTAAQLEQLLPSPHIQHYNGSIPPRAVVGLFMSSIGMAGSLPAALGQLSYLEVLMLGDNPQLSGVWPAGLVLPHLLHLDVQVRLLSLLQWYFLFC